MNRGMLQQESGWPKIVRWGIFFILSAYIVYEQAMSCIGVGMEIQLERHAGFIAGNSEFFNPWQYRVFSGWVLEGFIRAFNWLPLQLHPYAPYFALRLLQNILIFWAGYHFYKALSIKSWLLLLTGLLLLAFNMSNSNWQADLAFNTYFDVLFYLLAGYVVLKKHPAWIIPLTVIAVLNRETSGFIPFMLMLTAFDLRQFRLTDKSRLIYGLIALLLFGLLFVGVRWYYGLRPYEAIHDIDTPLEFFRFNMLFFNMYPQLIGTLGIVPLLAILGFRRWPFFLQATGLLIVPFWILIHLFKSMAMETRLFLVPQALIFIPALLCLIEYELRQYLTTSMTFGKEREASLPSSGQSS